MSKSSLDVVREALSLPLGEGELPSVAWPGAYPLYYLCSDGGSLCPECANKEVDLIAGAIKDKDSSEWEVVGYEANWEDDSMTCINCNQRIPCAYGE